MRLLSAKLKVVVGVEKILYVHQTTEKIHIRFTNRHIVMVVMEISDEYRDTA